MSVVEFSADAWQASAPGLQKGLARRVEAVSELLQGLDALAGSTQISGEGADGMRAYIREVHGSILQCLLLGLSTFQTAVGVYWAGYHEVDADGNFRLVKDELDTHVSRLERGMEQLRDFGTRLRRISADASHVVSLGSAGADAADQTVDALQRMHSIAKGQRDAWEGYEASDHGFALVRELVGKLGGIVTNVGSLTVGQGRSYTPGSFNLPAQELGPLTARMQEFCKNNQDAAVRGWKDAFDGYVADVDRARREKAGWDLLWDGVQIVAGAVITVVGLGLTPFTAGFSLGLTALGGTLLVGGINSAINHASIATTGNELDLAGMAAQWWDVNVAQPVADWGGAWPFVGGVLSGAGHVLSGMAQLNVKDAAVGVTALITDQAARDALWNQLTATVGQITSGNWYVAGQATAEVASVVIPGIGAVKAARAASLAKKAAEAAEATSRLTAGRQALEALQDTLKDAVREKNLPGYDPTGGLGWDRFLDKYFNGFDAEGRPRWKWPDDPPHTNGFTNGISKPADLVPGDTLERISFRDEHGRAADGDFAAPPGTTFDQLSLPPDRLGGNTTVVSYEVLKPLPDYVRMGEIAPGFGQPGLGTQYHFPGGIQKLVKMGYLKVIR